MPFLAPILLRSLPGDIAQAAICGRSFDNTMMAAHYHARLATGVHLRISDGYGGVYCL